MTVYQNLKNVNNGERERQRAFIVLHRAITRSNGTKLRKRKFRLNALEKFHNYELT